MKRSIYFMVSVLLFLAVGISSCSSDDDTPEEPKTNKLEGQWLLAGIKQVASGAVTMHALLENSYKGADGSVTTKRPPVLKFTSDGKVMVSDNPKGNTTFGMYLPWSDGEYKYLTSDTGLEKKLLIVGDMSGKFWFVEDEDALYFQIDKVGFFDSETFIFKRDTEENRYPSFYGRDEHINLLASDSLPEWLRSEAEKRRSALIAYGEDSGMACELYTPDPPYDDKERVYRFRLRGQTLYGWVPGYPGGYVFFTENGKGVDTEQEGMTYINHYDIYYNSTDWELVYVFEELKI